VPAAAQKYYPAGLQAAQTEANNNIYVFTNVANFTSFFKFAQPLDAAGYTFGEAITSIVDSSIFENTTFPAPTGYAPLSPNQLRETTLHELGHATDAVSNFPSTKGPYLTAIADDNTYLDSAGGGSACVAGGTGPFNGVIDVSTQAQFCSSNGTGGTLVGTKYNGKTNSQIAAASTYFFTTQTIPTIGTGYVELYAQSFAYMTYVQTLTNQTSFPFTVTVNGLLKKNFYQCAKYTAAQLAGLPYTPSYSCQ
jgi:hypothetical protein